MLDDGDRILDLVGIALVVGVLLGLGVVAVAIGASPNNASPDTDWTLERVNDSHVRITHAGGESVPAPELVVTVNSLRRNPGWTGLVTESESAVVRASEGQLVRIYWDAGQGNRELLSRWRV